MSTTTSPPDRIADPWRGRSSARTELHDLRRQAAQAARDTDLLATITACHPETLRTLKWTTYRLKEAAPQVLTS